MKGSLKQIVGLGAGLPALAHADDDRLHGVVALDHPVALVVFVVVSGLVLLAASWHSKRSGRKPRKPRED